MKLFSKGQLRLLFRRLELLQLRYRKKSNTYFLRRIKRFNSLVELLSRGINWLAFLFAFLSVFSFAYKIGFPLSQEASEAILWTFYISNYLFLFFIIAHKVVRILTGERAPWRTKLTELITVILLLIALLPDFISYNPSSGIIKTLIFHIGLHIRIPLLVIISIAVLIRGINILMKHKTNPSLMLAVSFVILIILGAGFLLLPQSSINGVKIIDAFFVSTSAVCVTGLTPIDIPSSLTAMGQIGLLVLIQIGGLGFMTITNFFGLFFMGNTSIYNHLLAKDVLSSDSMNSLAKVLLYIFIFTFIIEIAGALVVWSSIRGQLGMSMMEEIGFSIFHAISAFCNAGFSIYPEGLTNTKLLNINTLYNTLSILIILGGIGFPILSNFKKIVGYRISRIFHRCFFRQTLRERHTHLVNLNTNIVLYTTICLLVFGTLVIALFEWNNAFKDLDFYQKLTHSFFCSVSPRTAGFNAIDLARLTVPTILFTIILMWIGGGSQSTAGGIKVNVFATVLLSTYAVIRGQKRVQVFGREISQTSINQATSVILISGVILSVAIITLCALEPALPPLSLIFEAFSAIGTVGLSINLTPQLSESGKFIVMLLMFIGRVGMITILFGLVRKVKFTNFKYPAEQIIIN